MNDTQKQHQHEQAVVRSVEHALTSDKFLPRIIQILHDHSALSAEQFSERAADLIALTWEGGELDPEQMAKHLGVELDLLLRVLCAWKTLVTGTPHAVVAAPPNKKRN